MILRRYILGRVIGRTLFVVLAGLALYIVVDVMGISQQLARGSLRQILWLYLHRAPSMLLDVLPAAVVLGPMLAMGSLAKRFELSAIKCHGGTMTRVVAPGFAAIGLAAALTQLSLSEWVLPRVLPTAIKLQDRAFKIRGPRFWTFYLPQRWMRTPHGFLHSRVKRRGLSEDITYLRHDKNFRPELLIQARELREEQGAYWLIDGSSSELKKSDQAVQLFDRRVFPEALAPGTLAQNLGYPEVFGAARLWHIAAARRRQGGKTRPFVLAFFRRLADPLALILLALLVTPLASWSRRGQATERRLVEGAAVLGFVFAVRAAASALASTSIASCAVAAFVPIVTIVALGVGLWRRVEHERLWDPW